MAFQIWCFCHTELFFSMLIWKAALEVKTPGMPVF